MKRPAIVAIDGPAGAGKSTAAMRLAQRLGYVLIDTGALYRAVALAAKERGISWDDGAALGELTASLEMSFGKVEGGRPRLIVDGEDRSTDIRRPDISQGASRVSAHGPVREALLAVQRQMGARGGVVLEGRDIGTVVFPDADLKVFLTASTDARARRRFEELTADGATADFEDVRREIEVRDARDSNREVAPLKPADDAIILDSTVLDLEAVVEALLALVDDSGPEPGT